MIGLDIEDIINASFGIGQYKRHAKHVAYVNRSAEDTTYILHIPGVDKSEVNAEVTDNGQGYGLLNITTTNKEWEGSIFSVELQQHYDPSLVTIKVSNGVLTVVIPRKPPAIKSVKLEVK